jgi:hypothetical protein
MSIRLVQRWLVIITASVIATGLRASDEFERPPIEYSKATPNNAISRLQGQLDKGEKSLERDPRLGYLPALLQALNINPDSQMLVYSKTSLQVRRITPRTPRAIYFNDDLAVGYCQSGDVLEVSATDNNLGTVFYTVDQKSARPIITRQTDNCLVCHSSSRTESVPGHLARSVFVDATGQPILSAGSQTVDYRTPIDKRWGGWYVTGTHGEQSHHGNMVFTSGEVPPTITNTKGLNQTDLSSRLDITRYLQPTSDIVALMVYEHQNVVHNKITQANFTTRQALAYDADMTKAFGEPAGTRFDSSKRRIESAAEELVQALLFCEEAPLSAPVAGTSGFAQRFGNLGPRDHQGRSLRDLDLRTRLFEYPCSYLIYSEAFDALPGEVLRLVWQKLGSALSIENNSKTYAHLSADDRVAIRDILRATKNNLPLGW